MPCCRAGDAAMVLKLLAQGQKVDSRDKHSRTALHLAAWAGQVKISLPVAHHLNYRGHRVHPA